MTSIMMLSLHVSPSGLASLALVCTYDASDMPHAISVTSSFQFNLNLTQVLTYIQHN